MPTKFHAVMLDETRCEFGAEVEADTREEAYEQLAERYPESRCVQLESPEDTRKREDTMHDLIRRGADFDDEGRPFFPHGDEDEDYDDEEDDQLITEDLWSVIEAKGFSFDDYFDGEQRIMKPELESKGFTDITFHMGERDSFGPLSRIVRATDANGNRRTFMYG